MSSEVSTARFGDLLTADGIRNGIYKSKEFHGSGQKIINMGELFGNPRLFGIPMKRVELSESEKNRFIVKEGDLLFARRSLVAEGAGKCCLVKEVNGDTVFESSIIRARINSDIASSEYLYYMFSSTTGRQLLGTILRQTAVSGITGTDLIDLEVPLPPLSEQKKIAIILSTIDDKIELNRSYSESTEELTEALFKSWLVDLDLVMAKHEGRQSRISTDINNLFPDSFERSEFGAVPIGWSIAALDEIATYLNGLALQKYPPKGDETDLPVIKIAQLRKRDVIDSDKCSNEIGSEYVVENGDVIFSWSGSLLVDIWTGGRGALNQHLFKVTSTKYEKWFFYLWTKCHLGEFQAIAKSKATTMGHIQRKHLSGAKVLVPPSECLNQLSMIFSPLLQRQIEARLESATLASLRDVLLPRLISGELRIPDAERMLEEVGI